MNKLDLLKSGFILNDPANTSVINDLINNKLFIIPKPYVEFLLISNGIVSDEFILLEIEEIFQRNQDYEIKLYLPNYIMIGDNNGGSAILMNIDDYTIYLNGLGSLLPEGLVFCSSSLEEFLCNKHMI